jgi:hypothetical protein
MDGGQETPPITTNARGLGIFNLAKDQSELKVKVLVGGLSGPIAGAHLHVGAPGTAGSVVSDLNGFYFRDLY